MHSDIASSCVRLSHGSNHSNRTSLMRSGPTCRYGSEAQAQDVRERNCVSSNLANLYVCSAETNKAS